MNEQPQDAGAPTPEPTPENPPAPAGGERVEQPVEAPAPAEPASEKPHGTPGGERAEQPAEAPAPAESAPPAGAAASEASPTPAEGGEAGGQAPEKPKRRRRRRRKKRPAETGEGGTAEGGAAETTSAPAAGTDAEPAPKRKRQKRRKGGGEAPPSRKAVRRPEHLGTIAVKALSEMARALLDAEGVDPFGRPRWLDLRLRVPLEPDRDAARSSGDVVRQLVERVGEVRRHESALKPGSVYCYFSDSAEAPTSRPTKPREVFDGFGSTGRPTFTDFVTLAIERRDPGIDELVNGEDIIVTHVSMGRVLRTQQLHEFGAESPVYRILGQVDAGLYPMLGSDQKAAFSFQLLKGTTLDGLPRFRLHWVGAADVRDIADPMVASILKRFQQRLDRESLRFAGLGQNGTAPDEEEFVLPLLQELSKRLAGRARRVGRRTEHATQRSDERQRPTAKAWDDAKVAGDDRILRDDEQGTIVVVGPKNRVHVFSFDAKHVTSFVMTGGHVQKRKAEGRWHGAEPEERGEFRIALKRRLKEGDTEVAEGDQPTG